jgi:peptidoglycan-N-acetylglucosamine deacetylase
VLEILEHYNARATFFLVGKNAEAHPDLVHALLAKNHAIGSHGWEHIDGWRTKTKAFVKNAERFPAEISTSLFRPPYGRIFPWQAKTLQSKGLKIIMWSLLSRDYAALPDLDAALEKIIKLTADGSIVVFHDSAKAKNNCLYLLPRFLDHFKKQGIFVCCHAHDSETLNSRAGVCKLLIFLHQRKLLSYFFPFICHQSETWPVSYCGLQ